LRVILLAALMPASEHKADVANRSGSKKNEQIGDEKRRKGVGFPISTLLTAPD